MKNKNTVTKADVAFLMSEWDNANPMPVFTRDNDELCAIAFAKHSFRRRGAYAKANFHKFPHTMPSFGEFLQSVPDMCRGGINIYAAAMAIVDRVGEGYEYYTRDNAASSAADKNVTISVSLSHNVRELLRDFDMSVLLKTDAGMIRPTLRGDGFKGAINLTIPGSLLPILGNSTGNRSATLEHLVLGHFGYVDVTDPPDKRISISASLSESVMPLLQLVGDRSEFLASLVRESEFNEPTLRGNGRKIPVNFTIPGSLREKLDGYGGNRSALLESLILRHFGITQAPVTFMLSERARAVLAGIENTDEWLEKIIGQKVLTDD